MRPRVLGDNGDMFTPSQIDVRRFFCQVRSQQQQGLSLDAMETLAGLWIEEHPEFHADLDNVDQALSRMYQVEDGQTNPFLHLSMHLSISEQCSIDQPQGVRQAIELLAAKKNSLHEAHHLAMECLGRMVWESQRSGRPPDGQGYLDQLQRLATRD